MGCMHSLTFTDGQNHVKNHEGRLVRLQDMKPGHEYMSDFLAFANDHHWRRQEASPSKEIQDGCQGSWNQEKKSM